jgi:glutamate carboxypeptidase
MTARDASNRPGPTSDEFASIAPRILEAVRAREEEWCAFLVGLAELESPSTEPDTQEPVLRRLASAFREVGLGVRRLRGRSSGGMLLARPPKEGRAPYQLLLGHCDTVWPVGTLERMPVVRDGYTLRGPGVFDMKAGLTHVVVALRVLRDLGLAPTVAPVVFVNSDEETGSADSTRHIERLARPACRTFVLEPALDPEGRIKTARKGTGRFSVRVKGKSAHAGLDPGRGASAIQELALVIQQLHGLTDPARGVMVNVGVVRGGVRPNVVAAEASAEVDVRVDSLEEGARVAEAIRGIRASVSGCSIEVSGSIDRVPLERTPGNRRLWSAALGLGRSMGLELEEGRAGGASDGNTTSLVSPTLDGLGAVGDGAHADHEYVDVPRSLERCALLAGLLLLPHGLEPERP